MFGTRGVKYDCTKFTFGIYRNSRRKYYKHRDKARRNPKKYLSLIVDKMDQATTALPHLLDKSKVTSGYFFLRVTIYLLIMVIWTFISLNLFEDGIARHSFPMIARICIWFTTWHYILGVSIHAQDKSESYWRPLSQQPDRLLLFVDPKVQG